MVDVIIMPKLGFNMDEGKLIRWYAKEGEDICKGKPLFAIETDKTSIDIEATADGTVRKILLEEGETVPVTLPIAIVAGRDENIDAALRDALAQLGKPEEADSCGGPQADAACKQSGTPVPGPAAASTADGNKTAEQAGSRDFDVIVIGGGPGGYVAAIKAAQAGKRTAVIEKEKLGGVCLNKGCIPTKALLKSAAVLRDIRERETYGIAGLTGNAALDMGAVQKRKAKIISQLVGGVEGLLKANGVTIVRENGVLKDAHTVAAGAKEFTTDYIIIATGSSVKPSPVQADPSMRMLTSDDALELGEIPKHIVIVGGGVIGVEFASFFASAGSSVTLVEFLDQILPMADKAIADGAASMLKSMGIDVHTSAKVSEITKDMVVFEQDGRKQSIRADMVLVSVGRIPNTQGIGCEALGIRMDRGAVVTDQSLRTSVENIFAIGDVNGKVMLAHTASAEAAVAVEAICGYEAAMRYDTIPSVVFTQPEIAWVGLTEAQAREKYGKIRVGHFPLMANGKAKVEGEEKGFIKVIITEEYHEIVGVHLFCIHASDMIEEAALAMNLEATAEEVARSTHPHPSVSEIFHEAFYAALDRAIHFF